ncbi:hypothetical protein AB833_05900 [Chromatiales bacterium (ex Bugula neritina AB1)]|nr:hypothetical protein AB833_05900 [Chromatiales bacterium (ex Bugula neritina AB1)]
MNSDLQLLLLALSIFSGVLFPSLAAWWQPLLPQIIFLLFVFAIVQIRFSDAYRTLQRNRNCWLILLWQLVLLPVLAAAILYPLMSDQWYVFTLATLCTGSITATTALSRLFGLNDALALVVCLGGALLMPLPLYVLLTFAVEGDASIDFAVYLTRIVVFIVVPFIVVFVFRKIASVQIDAWVREKVPHAVLILLVFFGLAVMDGVQTLLLERPWLLLSYIALAFGISIVVQGVTYIALSRLGIRDAKTACLLCAYRNMGIVAAIAGASLGEHFLIFVGVWQLPMYLLPLFFKRFYREAECN